MTNPNVLARGIEQVRRRRGVALAAGATSFVLLAAAIAFGVQMLSGATEGRRTLEAAVAVATSTPASTQPSTATATITPAATPTGTATATAIPGTVTTVQGYFPPPPPRTGPTPGNAYGIARISAPGLGVDHYVEILGVTDGVMQSPVDGLYAVGFYPDFSQTPGESGNAIFSAHETWNHQQGPFYQMHTAKAGDEIFVEMSDGRRLRYQVMSNTRYDINTIPMNEIVWPSKRAFGEQWLTLITCGGRIVYDASGFGEYLDRDVVIAKRAS